jgi:hypothetical protein
LAAEGLLCLLKYHSVSSELHGLKVAPSAPTVSHLLFAEDSLLLFRAATESAGKTQHLLDLYCLPLGQRVNRDKSSIFSVRVVVTSQDFIKFWGRFFAFVLSALIESSQGFKTFEFI